MEQLLFNDSKMFMKQRPNFVTEKQKEAFYRLNAQYIIDNGWSEDNVDDIASDLKTVSLGDSGYEIAKSLERGYCCYEIETEFIEFLDSLWSYYDELKTGNVISWVNATNPQHKFNVGDRLMYKENEVLVYELLENRAMYIINKDIKTKGGTLIPYEIIDEQANLI